MRKGIAFATALAMGLSFTTVSVQSPAFAKEKRYEAHVTKNRANAGERSVTCQGDAKRGEVTKGALYGAGGGALLGGAIGLGTIGGALVGAGAGAAIQNSQNNAACGR